MIHRRHVHTLVAFCICIAGAPPGLLHDARAEIPCLIDTLVGTDPFGFSQPGGAVDIDGDWIVAGAPSEGVSAAGAVYIYVRDGLGWKLDAKFVESPPRLWAQMGSAVAISGDRVIAGASTPGLVEFQFGRAYVYRRVAGVWQEEALLAPSLPAERDGFGISVAIENEVAVVGAIYFGPPDPGKAFVFRWNGSAWIEDAILFAPGAVEHDLFGYSVALSGNRIAVGAVWDDMGDGARGSVYVFKYNGASWVQEARVRPNDDETNHGFGVSVALRGDELVVGASGDQTFSFSNGAVYVFEWSGTSWQQQAKLFPSGPAGDIQLGHAVDIGSDAIAATSGAPPGHPYTAHVFSRNGGNWVQRFSFEWGGNPSLSDNGSLLVFGNHVYGLGAFPPCIPVTSSWGVLVMALSVAAVGSICIRKRVKLSCVCVFVAVFWLLGFDNPIFAQVAGLEHPHHPERLIVRYKSETNPQARAAVPSRHGATVERNDPYVDGPAFVKVAPSDLAAKLVALRNDPDVLYAEPDYEVTATLTPNDPLYDEVSQWGLGAVRAPQAWNSYTGVDNADFKVAVIDSGIAYDHPDLVDNIWTNPGEIPGDGIDNDANGYIDDVHGYDFVGTNDSNPYPEGIGGHGTIMAGILGARTNNALGVAGMVWRCKIVALRFINGSGIGLQSDAGEALDYCIANGIRVSNNSYQFPAYSQSMWDKINAAKTAGHLFVTAVGNDGINLDVTPKYPACYNLSNIITVAGSNFTSYLWEFSSFGSVCADLAAPAQTIRSTAWDFFQGNIYVYDSGISAAAPFVTGTAVLMMGKFPGLSFQAVRTRILTTARVLPATDCKTATGGILDAAAALGDCNNNTVFDATDIANQTSSDCDNNGLPDECDYDCDGNGIPEACEVSLRDPCCFPANPCHDCLNLTPCECAARGGVSHPSIERCAFFDCGGPPPPPRVPPYCY